MGEPLLALIAKPPIPGRVKTRLCPPLTPHAAAALYRGFLRDSLGLIESLTGIGRAIVLPPESDEASLADLVPDDFWIRRQARPGLSEALGGTVAEALARGHDGVILFNGDTPSLPGHVLAQAIAALAVHDLVIGPTTDGGYYLIGLKRNVPELFEDMRWSTPTVFAETTKRARRQRLGLRCLSPWYDIDTIDDLRLLAAHLAADPTLGAPATRSALCTLKATAVGRPADRLAPAPRS